MAQLHSLPIRLTIAAGGLAGAAGVMAAAASSHGGETRNLAAIAAICLAHGPVLLALGLARLPGRLFGVAAALLAVGTLVFGLDLLAREMWGQGVFPLAAPLGGVGMIGGWVMVVLGGVFYGSGSPHGSTGSP